MTELEQLLIEQNRRQSEQISELTQQVKNLNEQIAYMNRKRFGASSEQNVPGQTDLLGNPFESSETTELEQTVVVPSHRRKVRGYKEAQLADLTTEEVHYELSEKDRFCDVCDTYLTELGSKNVRSTVKYVPAKLVEQHHILHSYECPHCKLYSDKASVKSAPVPKPLFHSSFASAELLATVFTNKFELNLPLYRQVKLWQRLKLDLTDRTMTNWVIAGANKWLSPIYKALHDTLMTDEIIHIDETPTQTLIRSDGKPATSQSRLWVMHSSKDSDKQIAYYHASLSRSHEVTDQLLRDYSGIIQSDGYSVYQGLHEGIMNVNCWVHVRRKFWNQLKMPKTVRRS